MKIAWAVNPFDTNTVVYKRGQELIKALKPSSVELVFVAAPSVLDLSLAFDVPEKDRFTKYAKTKLEQFVKKHNLSSSKNTVLNVKSSSTTTQALELSKYLAKQKIDCVIMPTHARSGMDRFFQGSFTETMLLNSKVDVLVFNPTLKFSKKIKNVLFGHDGSKNATKHIHETADLLSTVNPKIEAVYVVPTITNTFDSGTILFAENYRQIVEKSLASIRSQIQKSNPGVHLTTLETSLPVSEALLERAKKSKSDLIVVTAKVGGLIAGLGGSISRQIVRASQLPVLVKKH